MKAKVEQLAAENKQLHKNMEQMEITRDALQSENRVLKGKVDAAVSFSGMDSFDLNTTILHLKKENALLTEKLNEAVQDNAKLKPFKFELQQKREEKK